MIIRHTRKREDREEDTHLTLNKDYIVISVLYTPSSGTEFTIETDGDNYPALFSSKYFDLIDARLPPNFMYKFYENGITQLRPLAFDGNFWERFHDGDPEAEKVFEETVRKIKAFHNFA